MGRVFGGRRLVGRVFRGRRLVALQFLMHLTGIDQLLTEVLDIVDLSRRLFLGHVHGRGGRLVTEHFGGRVDGSSGDEFVHVIVVLHLLFLGFADHSVGNALFLRLFLL